MLVKELRILLDISDNWLLLRSKTVALFKLLLVNWLIWLLFKDKVSNELKSLFEKTFKVEEFIGANINTLGKVLELMLRSWMLPDKSNCCNWVNVFKSKVFKVLLARKSVNKLAYTWFEKSDKVLLLNVNCVIFLRSLLLNACIWLLYRLSNMILGMKLFVNEVILLSLSCNTYKRGKL